MADLLSALARRALSPPGVRPRVPSRFEGDVPPMLTVEAREAQAAPPLPRSVPTEELGDAAGDRLAESVKATQAEPRLGMQPEPMARPESIAPPAVRLAEVTGTIGEVAGRIADPPSRSAPVPDPVAPATPASLRPAPALESLADAPTREHVAASSIEHHLVRESWHEREVREPIERRIEHLVTPPLPAVSPRPRPSNGPSLAPSVPAAMAAPAPDVQIHIGRIEIRVPASPPAATKEPGSTAPRPATLDEVLARRVGRS
jgi:hypothetical protein